MGFKEAMFRQCRKPIGWMGWLAGRGMNRGHADLWQWALGHITIPPEEVILDVGCGGGKAVQLLAQMVPAGKVVGIDHSQAMVRLARRVNRALINSGCVEIRRASVSSLPYPDSMFDLATAFEAYYFWPSLIDDLKEIRRVLKQGGTLLLANEVYRHQAFEQRNASWVELASMHIHTPDEYRSFLAEAGFAIVEITEVAERNWILAVARERGACG